jgi:CheY-like chemotaxis protein/two-component sensor histidine kinase
MCRDVISRQLQQITRLVDDLLDVGRITSGKIHLELHPVELGSVLEEAVEAIEPFVRTRGHKLVLELSDTPTWVAGDRARLLQIASNLLNNAAKFTPRGGRIVATIRRSATHAELSVADNGIGIAQSRLQDIFNLFVQGDEDVARTEGGLGLGLSLVQQLTMLHGGEVSAFSGGGGKGAEFVVSLPLVRAPRSQDDASPEVVSPRARQILVVDDNRDAADTLVTLLQAMGYRARTAYDARTALDHVRNAMPDVAILDIGLPDMDGWALAREIRAQCGDAVALIALTGYGQEQDRDATSAAGFRDHLTKPLSGEALIAALGRLFNDA